MANLKGKFITIKIVYNCFLAQNDNFPEHTVEEGFLYPIPHPKILSYNCSIVNIKSMICWRTAYGLGLVCHITSVSEI